MPCIGLLISFWGSFFFFNFPAYGLFVRICIFGYRRSILNGFNYLFCFHKIVSVFISTESKTPLEKQLTDSTKPIGLPRAISGTLPSTITTRDDKESPLGGASSPEEYFYDSLEDGNNSRLSNISKLSEWSFSPIIWPYAETFWHWHRKHCKVIMRNLSHDMIKPTTWVCAQRRFRSAWASAQSAQSFRLRSVGS